MSLQLGRISYKYFTIKDSPQSPKRKTRDYTIVSKSTGNPIGYIDYYPSWRQHIFCADKDTVWSSGCLQDVINFLDKIKNGK